MHPQLTKYGAGRLLVLASLVVFLGVGIWAQAQPPAERPREVRPFGAQDSGQVLSGENIGVRLTGPVRSDGTVQGVLVVKVNGQWLSVVGGSSPRLQPTN